MRLTITLTMFVLLPAFALSATIYVPDDYTTIQAAIDAAATGDTIIVRPGTYVENIDFVGKAIALVSEHGPGTTTVDGNHSGSVVTFAAGEMAASVLQGFTLTNGTGTYDGAGAYRGGGIYCTSSPTITGNVITLNDVPYDGYGGGIYCTGSPLISDNTITTNHVSCSTIWAGGAGLWIETGSPTVANNTVAGNTAFHYGRGGGIYCIHTGAHITDCTISDNHAYGHGGGIYCFECSPLISLNAILSNTANYHGGGISCEYSSAPAIQSNTISYNTADDGGGLDVDNSSAPEIRDNTITYNHAEDGGGINCSGGAAGSPLIDDNFIAYNSATKRGGGILCTARGCVANNSILANSAGEHGGGLFCEDYVVLSFNTILDNSAAWSGGGAYIQSTAADFVFTSSIMMSNYAGYFGGGLAVKNCWPTLTNSIVAGNTALLGGGGIYCQGSNPTILNFTICNNHTTAEGGGVCRDPYSYYPPIISNSILWDNEASAGPQFYGGDFDVSYCNVMGGWVGAANINTDPLFVDPANGDYHIARGSLCRNAGTNSPEGLSPEDFEGDVRIAEGTADIGADEYFINANPFLTLDIKCNGQDSNVTVFEGDTVTVTIKLESWNNPAVPCDIWVLARKPSGDKRSYFDGKWWKGWCHEYHTGGLYDIFDTVVDKALPVGGYEAYLGIDTQANGNLNMPALIAYDAVDFEVVP